MSVKPQGLLGNIKIANVFHHTVQAENMNFYNNITEAHNTMAILLVAVLEL